MIRCRDERRPSRHGGDQRRCLAIGRYLLMEPVVNLLYGLPVGVGLFLIGVPNALLWGMLATI